MNDNTRLQIILAAQGFFPAAIKAVLEDIIAESLHTYLSDSGYITATLMDNPQLLTDVLEMELEDLKGQFPKEVRYTKVEFVETLDWMIKVHLEEASAPCKISLEMRTFTED